MNLVKKLVGLLLLVIFAAPAYSADQHKDHDKSAAPKSGSSDMHRSMMADMKHMNAMKMSGDTDRDFAMMMKMHHEGALKMAEAELQHGKDPEMQRMAKQIIESQKKEIAEFDLWLKNRPSKK